MKGPIAGMASICHLENLAYRELSINRRHPGIKGSLLLFYIVILSSLGKYALSPMILMALGPMFYMTKAQISTADIGSKLWIPALIGASVGLLNPVFDQQTFQLTSHIMISAGWLSMLTILLKSLLISWSVFLFISTTKIEEVAGLLLKIRVPSFLVIQLMLMMRYIMIFFKVLEKNLVAYDLRGGEKNKVELKIWGQMVAQLFSKTVKTSYELHNAMTLRGFSLETFVTPPPPVNKKDVVFLCCGIGVILMPQLFL